MAQEGHDSTDRCWLLACQTEKVGRDRQRVRTTYQYQLMPTPEQQRAWDQVVWRCRMRDNGALQERKTAWERCHVASTYSQQKAELPALKAGCPDDAAVNAHVLPEVILRVERAFPAFCRRVQQGEQPGSARVPGYHRATRCTAPQDGGGAVLDGGLLRLATIGRLPIRLHRPLDGTPKTGSSAHAAAGWYAGLACAEVPPQALPRPRCETGRDVGVPVFLITAAGELVETPCHSRTAEQHLAQAHRRGARRKQGSKRRRTVVARLQRQHQQVQRQRSDCQHKPALALLSTDDTS